MKILFSSDLHGNIEGYKRFVDILKNQEYSLGILSGDLTSYHKNPNENDKEIRDILEMSNKPILFKDSCWK